MFRAQKTAAAFRRMMREFSERATPVAARAGPLAFTTEWWKAGSPGAAVAAAAAAALVGALCASSDDCVETAGMVKLSPMIEEVFPSLCKISAMVGDSPIGGGSAFVISEDGLIVTNHHVFQAFTAYSEEPDIRVLFDDGRVYRCVPVAADVESDIAIGRILAPAGHRFKPFRIGSSSKMKRGDPLCVLGAPLGGSLVPTVGVLSGIRYVADDDLMNSVLNSRSDWQLLQVDANMSSGSSGGPIVNEAGEVVGVSVMVQTVASQTGGVGLINFGVAIDQAWPIIQSLLQKGRVDRASIGMTIVLVDRVQSERELAVTGVPLLPGPPLLPAKAAGTAAERNTGLLVTYLVPGKPAHLAGLREGDVILDINGRRMSRKGDYFAALGPTFVEGQELVCTVYRPPMQPQGGAVGGGGGRRWRRQAHEASEGGAAAAGVGELLTLRLSPVCRDASPQVPRSRWAPAGMQRH